MRMAASCRYISIGCRQGAHLGIFIRRVKNRAFRFSHGLTITQRQTWSLCSVTNRTVSTDNPTHNRIEVSGE